MRRIGATLVAAGLLMLVWQQGAPASAAQIYNHPRVAAPRQAAAWASSNWSGYAQTGSGYTSITGSWTVPAVTGGHGQSYSSSWIGIDGFNNSSLIQTGTEQDFYNGSAHYSVWWEILPAAETPIAMTVGAGDAISASITKGSGSSWTITISDVTRATSFSTVRTYTGPQTSAEWIQEAPTVGGRTAPLAHYATFAFDLGTVNGVSAGLSAAQAGVMVQKRAQVSTPSNPDGDGDGFAVAYGSVAPPPPPS